MKKSVPFILSVVCAVGAMFQTVYAQKSDYQIFVTTPGYTSIKQYDKSTFENTKRDFRIMQGEVWLRDSLGQDGRTYVELRLGTRRFHYYVSEDTPFIRLVYDRNRRLFTGVGCNFVENNHYTYQPPTFKGTSLQKLPAVWLPNINRTIVDRTLLDKEKPTFFVIEADIDEQGIIHRIIPLSDTLRQYSKVIIDEIYDKAIRGWQPAMRNGTPYRSLAQMVFELKK